MAQITATETIDKRMMARALKIAARGLGFTAPNPMVGCVIAHGDKIVGEGWHRGCGWHPVHGVHHAEIEALRDAGADAVRDATAYVTLEPCHHRGKTGPCAHALIEAGIARLVYAMADPNVQAAGGANACRNAGMEVVEGPLADQARALNRAWISTLTSKRPYVIAKYAASLDGKIATHTGDSQWITGSPARRRAHDLRQMADAIIVGADTVLADNPSLTVRDNPYPAHPLRVILDSTARTNPLANLFRSETGSALLVTTQAAPKDRVNAFIQQGIEVLCVTANADGRIDLSALMDALFRRGCITVMVEGGAQILGSFFDHNLIDEVWAFLAPIILGGGPNAFGGKGADQLSDALRMSNIKQENLDGDILIRGQIIQSNNQYQRGVSCSRAS